MLWTGRGRWLLSRTVYDEGLELGSLRFAGGALACSHVTRRFFAEANFFSSTSPTARTHSPPPPNARHSTSGASQCTDPPQATREFPLIELGIPHGRANPLFTYKPHYTHTAASNSNDIIMSAEDASAAWPLADEALSQELLDLVQQATHYRMSISTALSAS